VVLKGQWYPLSFKKLSFDELLSQTTAAGFLLIKDAQHIFDSAYFDLIAVLIAIR
jgi:hypothetical protein